MLPSLPIPAEVFREIALHLPSPHDVVSMSLTNHFIHDALMTPALFKGRVRANGWDMEAWEEEDIGSEYCLLRRWMRIDLIHSRAQQLLDEASVEGYFLDPSGVAPIDQTSVLLAASWLDWRSNPTEEGDDDDTDRPVLSQSLTSNVPVIDGVKASAWLEQMSLVLPSLLTHNRSRNIKRLTDPAYRGLFKTYLRALVELCFSAQLTLTTASQSNLWVVLDTSAHAWFERASFCLATLLVQCGRDTVMDIFGNVAVEVRTSLIKNLRRSWGAYEFHRNIFTPGPATYQKMSRRYSACFIIQAITLINLQLDPLHDSLKLLPPSPPAIEPELAYDWPFAPFKNSFNIDRPWLANCASGTPLARLTDEGTKWAGYYCHSMQESDWQRLSPMVFTLKATPPLPGTPRVCRRGLISFFGKGSDDTGDFSLRGTCHTKDGMIDAQKVYANNGPAWHWDGVLTPYGMVGRWGEEGHGGWWWVWPRAWSP